MCQQTLGPVPRTWRHTAICVALRFRASQEPELPAFQRERVDEVELGAGIDRIGENDGRRALVYTDLDDALRAGGQAGQEFGFGRAMHCAWRDHSNSERDGAERGLVPDRIGGKPADSLR